jgi:hypothetical protein
MRAASLILRWADLANVGVAGPLIEHLDVIDQCLPAIVVVAATDTTYACTSVLSDIL